MTNKQKKYILDCIAKDINNQINKLECGHYESVKEITSALTALDESNKSYEIFKTVGY